MRCFPGSQGHTHTEILRAWVSTSLRLAEAEIHKGFQHLLLHPQPAKPPAATDHQQWSVHQQSAKLVDTFLEDVKNLYHSKLFINFRDAEEAKKKINDYVEKGSHGKIVDLVKDLDQAYSFCSGELAYPLKVRLHNQSELFCTESPQNSLKHSVLNFFLAAQNGYSHASLHVLFSFPHMTTKTSYDQIGLGNYELNKVPSSLQDFQSPK